MIVDPPSMETPIEMEGVPEAKTEQIKTILYDNLHTIIVPGLVILMIIATSVYFEGNLLPVLVTGFAGLLILLAFALTKENQSPVQKSLHRAHAKAQKANCAKTRFLAIASHEMRTPLNGILGMSKLLDDTAMTPEQANYNRAIKTSGEALFAFVEDMLDFTRIESGHFKLHLRPTNIEQLMEEVCELLSPRAHDKQLEIAAITDSQIPAWVKIDASRLRQVLINLTGNAIKFTDEGGISMRAELYHLDTGEPALQFIISDTGPGICDSDKQRIFDEFEQGETATSRSYEGAGLGLAISRAIVDKMAGSLIVRDNKPKGTQFIARVPFDCWTKKFHRKLC